MKDETPFRPLPVFPKNSAPDYEQIIERIRLRAYILWEHDGAPESNGVNYWLRAEEQLFGPPVGGGYKIYVGDVRQGSSSLKPVVVKPSGE